MPVSWRERTVVPCGWVDLRDCDQKTRSHVSGYNGRDVSRGAILGNCLWKWVVSLPLLWGWIQQQDWMGKGAHICSHVWQTGGVFRERQLGRRPLKESNHWSCGEGLRVRSAWPWDTGRWQAPISHTLGSLPWLLGPHSTYMTWEGNGSSKTSCVPRSPSNFPEGISLESGGLWHPRKVSTDWKCEGGSQMLLGSMSWEAPVRPGVPCGWRFLSHLWPSFEQSSICPRPRGMVVRGPGTAYQMRKEGTGRPSQQWPEMADFSVEWWWEGSQGQGLAPGGLCPAVLVC